jgi:hypothetical protein
MNLPFFTTKDPSLAGAQGGRDPLGMQPVWSAFGRGLVPNLASPVGQINGIKAVLLIHWLDDEMLAEFPRNKPFREYFRLMEGVLEYYLWRYPKKGDAGEDAFCFGKQALNTHQDSFTVSIDDNRTAVNGLYQYYRGTCRRAELLQEWEVREPMASVLASCWNESATAALKEALKGPLVHQKDDLIPDSLLASSPQVKKALDRLFSSPPLHKVLQQQLLGNDTYLALARECSALLEKEKEIGEAPQQGWIRFRVEQLSQWSQKENEAVFLRVPLERIEYCEEFLLILQDSFDCLLASPGATLAQVSKELDGLERKLRRRAARFLTLEGSLQTDRMKQMLSLAHVLANGSTTDFLSQLLEHHRQCMAERRRDPIVLQDAGSIIVATSAERDKEAALTRLETALPWDNSYYLWNAGTIYRQLFGGANG